MVFSSGTNLQYGNTSPSFQAALTVDQPLHVAVWSPSPGQLCPRKRGMRTPGRLVRPMGLEPGYTAAGLTVLRWTPGPEGASSSAFLPKLPTTLERVGLC